MPNIKEKRAGIKVLKKIKLNNQQIELIKNYDDYNVVTKTLKGKKWVVESGDWLRFEDYTKANNYYERYTKILKEK